LGFPADPATYPSRVRSDSVLVRSGFEDYQVGKHGVSSGGGGLAESGCTQFVLSEVFEVGESSKGAG
jgi:hypothetical protein